MWGRVCRLSAQPFIRFASIGVACLIFVQVPLLLVLAKAGMNELAANAIGFVASAVVNYDLQRRCNFKSVRGSWLAGAVTFQLTSLASLGVNTIIVAFLRYALGWPVVVAALLGGFCSSGFNFVVSRLVIFSSGKKDTSPMIREDKPTITKLRKRLAGKTLAVFLPAYREALNLPIVVRGLHKYLRSLRLAGFQIIIVNDGSPDNTGEVADQLAGQYREVVAVHHPVNMGYGGALTTGFRHAVQSGYDFWAFSDADRQFSSESFGTLLRALIDEKADMAVGQRLGRRESDSQFRYWLGRAWHFFGMAVVGKNSQGGRLLSVSDVDCGMKVGVTASLAQIVPFLGGQAAAISPELIARSNIASHRIVERGVTHLSRVAGVSTGDDPRVMIRSALNIFKLGIRLRKERWFGSSVRWAVDGRVSQSV